MNRLTLVIWIRHPLLQARQVCGPLTVLKDLWGDESLVDENHTLYQYVIELQTNLQECAKIWHKIPKLVYKNTKCTSI